MDLNFRAVAREMRRRISFIAKWFFPSQSSDKVRTKEPDEIDRRREVRRKGGGSGELWRELKKKEELALFIMQQHPPN